MQTHDETGYASRQPMFPDGCVRANLPALKGGADAGERRRPGHPTVEGSGSGAGRAGGALALGRGR